jgi:plastocyanin
MRSLKIIVMLSIGVWMAFAIGSPTPVIADDDGGTRIALLDDCDPRIGAGWNTATDQTQCIREEGSVSRAEFAAFLASPFSLSTVGHPAWRIAPTYLKPEAGDRVRVRNGGGRGHTFTEVAQYGGGFIPVLNIGLIQAPECTPATAPVIPPGGHADVTGLAVGNHKFQCCIHPWMRALVKVEPDDN